MPRQHTGAAAASRAAAVDILPFDVKNHAAAIGVICKGESLSFQKLQHQLAAQKS